MDLPLFPLHTVLCPGVALPLHIFEPRYRRMVQRCILGETSFGVILIRDGRDVGPAPEALASVGTLADLREANRYADGRYDLLTVGSRRFRLDTVSVGEEGYLLGSVTLLEEPVGDPARAHDLAVRAGRRFSRYLELLRPRKDEPEDSAGIEIRLELVEVDEPDDADEPIEADERAGATDADDPSSTTADTASEDQRDALLEVAARRLTIPDDPVSLSYLLGGIVQVELSYRQRLLEAETAEDRLALLTRLLDRELLLLERRLRVFEADPRSVAIRRN